MKKIFLLTAVLSLTTAVFAAGEPFAAWNFDNVNGTIVPPVAGKRNLVLQNMPNVKVVPGKNGQAVAFLGKDKELCVPVLWYILYWLAELFRQIHQLFSE